MKSIQFSMIVDTLMLRWSHSTRGRITMKSTRTWPFAGPLAHSLAPLTHSLAPYCSLRSRAPLRSFVRSLARSLAPELMGKIFLNESILYSFNPLCIGQKHTFLDAFSHLYKRVCPSVGPSVRPSIRPSVHMSVRRAVARNQKPPKMRE